MGKFNTLDQADLTRLWTVKERAALAYYLEPKAWTKGETFYEARSKERRLFIVESGCIRVSMEASAVDFKSGDSFGELSLIQPTIKLSSALALEDSKTWMLSYDKWVELKDTAPTVASQLIEGITSKLAKLINDMIPPTELFSPKVEQG